MTQIVHTRTARETLVEPAGIICMDMLRITEEMLQDALAGDEAEIAAMKQELALLPTPRLRIHRNGMRYYFGETSPTKAGAHEVSISADPARVYDLARRDYLQHRIRTMTDNAARVRVSLALCKDAVWEQRLRRRLHRFDDAGLDLSKILFTQAQNEWIDAPYSPNPFYQESLNHFTAHGIPVRSKSEARFGSFLESVGLPFRTDDLVTIHAGHGRSPFRDTYFADFKIPNLCGGITIHEHLGAFHIDEYSAGAMRRLNDYHNFTIQELPGRPVKHEEITWSFEHDLQSDESMKALLRQILLPTLH